MQPFTCPQCGHESSFDPWIESAHCPRCGFVPPTHGPRLNYVRWANRHTYQPFVDQLVAHWNGTHTAEPEFEFESQHDAESFYQEYQQTIGLHAPNYYPNRQEILIFVEAYAALRRGNVQEAAEGLGALCFTSPQFADALIWLTATQEDPAERLKYLTDATRLDPAHPLARDALAIAEGGIPSGGEHRAERMALTQCPQCGGRLDYEPGATKILCAHCGHELELAPTNVVDALAEPLHHLRLQRRYEGHSWNEAQRVLRCRGCGAELVMAEHLARLCAFCGSPNVLVQESDRILEQPDGFLPFAVEREHAIRTALDAQQSGLRRLTTWITEASWEVQDLQGVYLPFWIFDGQVETFRIVSGMVTTRKERLGIKMYENLLFPGFDRPTLAVLASVFPFDLKRLAPYEPRLLANWPAKLHTLDVEMIAEQARDTMIQRSRAQVLQMPGERHPTESQVLGLTYQLVLLPLWFARMVRRDRVQGALINGQTGKATLTLPTSPVQPERTGGYGVSSGI